MYFYKHFYTSILSLSFLICCETSYGLNREGCKYNGKILDVSKSPSELGSAYIAKVPDNFSGKRECFHPNGKLSEYSDYVLGRKEGVVKSYDEKGNIQEESQMKNDVRHGVFKRYYQNTNKLLHEWNYLNGNYQGLSKEYYENGKLKSLRMISKERDGAEMFYNKFGKMTSLLCKPIALPNDELLCGRKGLGQKVNLYFNDDNKIRKTMTYKKLKPEGEAITFNKNKEVTLKQIYKSGELIRENSFSPKGNYQKSVNGKEVTESFYFPSGKIKKTFVRNGFVKLTEIEFYENGSKKYESSLKNGIETIADYYDNHQIRCTYKNKKLRGYQKRDGTHTCYYEDGKIMSQENYTIGLLDGEQTSYTDEGLLISKRNYKNNVLLETWIYNNEGKIIENYQHESDGSRKLKPR